MNVVPLFLCVSISAKKSQLKFSFNLVTCSAGAHLHGLGVCSWLIPVQSALRQQEERVGEGSGALSCITSYCKVTSALRKMENITFFKQKLAFLLLGPHTSAYAHLVEFLCSWVIWYKEMGMHFQNWNALEKWPPKLLEMGKHDKYVYIYTYTYIHTYIYIFCMWYIFLYLIMHYRIILYVIYIFNT